MAAGQDPAVAPVVAASAAGPAEAAWEEARHEGDSLLAEARRAVSGAVRAAAGGHRSDVPAGGAGTWRSSSRSK